MFGRIAFNLFAAPICISRSILRERHRTCIKSSPREARSLCPWPKLFSLHDLRNFATSLACSGQSFVRRHEAVSFRTADIAMTSSSKDISRARNYLPTQDAHDRRSAAQPRSTFYAFQNEVPWQATETSLPTLTKRVVTSPIAWTSRDQSVIRESPHRYNWNSCNTPSMRTVPGSRPLIRVLPFST